MLEILRSRLKKREAARKKLSNFTLFTKDDYILKDFHKNITDDIDSWVEGDNSKLMVFASPQHGKSEISTRRLPSYLLGKNPKLKIAVVCYNSTIARGFNRNVQDIILSEEYRELFPDTIIHGVTDPKAVEKMKEKGRQLERNSYMFETSEGGYLISVGVNGALTGKSVDILIMDDLYKGKMDAYSPVFRKRVEDFYNSVAETRLHNDSKQLILYTRWHEEDLAGVLLEKEPELWKVSKYEAIKETSDNERDKRKIGEALWPEKHSIERLLRIKKNDPTSFEALYQQNPRPLEGLLYENLKTYKKIPSNGIIKSYTDTADTGKDYLASVIYLLADGYIYILDIIYTQKKMEFTEPMVSNALIKHNVVKAKIESNNGGRGFARNVQRLVDERGKRVKISWFHQSQNKEARILSGASLINQHVLFPEGWESKFPQAYKTMIRFLADIKANDHDDLQDCLTGIIEEEFTSKSKGRAGVNVFAK